MPEGNAESTPKVVSYSPNSQKSKQSEPAPEQPTVEPVIKGSAVERKEPLHKKFMSAYAGDSAQSVGGYILMDIVVPATKNLIVDIVSQGINRLMFGSSRPTGGFSRQGGGVPYGKFFNAGASNNRQQESQPVMSTHARANHAFGEIILQTRSDAEIVLESLRDLIETYGSCKVVDLYQLVRVTPDFTDQKYGWTNLAQGRVLQIREGYLLDLPKPVVLP